MEQKELIKYLNQDILKMKSLNFDDSYIQEITRNTSKWAKTGILKGVTDSYHGRNLSSLLENQRLLNENSEVPSIPNDATTNIPVDLWLSQWKRCSLAAIRRVFGEKFIGYDLVSVQCMKKAGEQHLYFSDLNGKTNTTIVSVNSRILNLKWDYPIKTDSNVFLFEGQEYSLELDAECAAIESFSDKLKDIFTREIIRDLAAITAKSVVFDFENVNHLISYISGMSSYIAVKCENREATWLIASSSVIDLLADNIEFDDKIERSEQNIQKVGILNNKWVVIEDVLAPSGNILMGLKDPKNHYLSGYIFAPYLPIIPVKGWRTETTIENDYVAARYGKKLINSNFYGTLKVEKIPEDTQLDKDS